MRFGAALVFLIFVVVLYAQSPVVIDTSNCSPDGTGNIYVTPGVPFSCTLTATGGTPPYRWAISNGTLPDGFTLNPTTGVLSGMMLAAPASLGATPVKNLKKKPEKVILINLKK